MEAAAAASPASNQQSEDEEKEEEKKKLDVQQFIGQSLIKNNPDPNRISSLKHRARLLTGAPLIKGKAVSSSALKHPHYISMLQQHQMSSYYLYWQQQQQQQQQQQLNSNRSEDEDEEDQDGFVPRVIKPRRRRRHHQHQLQHGQHRVRQDSSDHEMIGQLEIAYEDELHFLPTDLLADEARLSDDGGSDSSKMSCSSPVRDDHMSIQNDHLSFRNDPSSTHNNQLSIRNDQSPPRWNPSPIRRPQLRHTESLQLSSFNMGNDDHQMTEEANINHHQLRKTFSWASSSPDHMAFSLFPRTGDLNLQLWNNVAGGGGSNLGVGVGVESLVGVGMGVGSTTTFRKTSSNLEETLKNMRIDNGETASISRKF